MVHNVGDTFPLAGIGVPTDEGDKPLMADITWQLTNNPGKMTEDNTTLNIQFTSKSTRADSGMGWLPVRAPVRAFADEPKANNMQEWIVGSGILRNTLNAGPETEGAGIVILHGNKLFNAGIESWHLREYVLDVSNTLLPVEEQWDYWDPNATERIQRKPIPRLSNPGVWTCEIERNVTRAGEDASYDQPW